VGEKARLGAFYLPKGHTTHPRNRMINYFIKLKGYEEPSDAHASLQEI